MINLSFENYRYFPTLRTRQAELRGLQHLNEQRKQQLLPLLTLGRWPRAEDFTKAGEKAHEAMGQLPYIIDLTNDSAHLGDQQRLLRNPAGGFASWRNFASVYPNAIPVAQMPADARLRDFTRQAQEIERSVGKLAFRIRDFSAETPLVIAALSSLDDASNAIVFVDCQYIRSALAAYITASVATINQLRTEFPELMIAILSTSFPSSTLPFVDASQTRGSIEILERELHSRLGGPSVAAYGDHGSIHSIVYDDAPIMRWAARVDYPRELTWYFERRSGDQTAAGYVSAAQAVVASDPDIGTREIWGEQMIIDAANGNPYGKAPAPWISVRVNIHLARQLDFSNRIAEEPDQGDDVDDLL